MFLTLQYANIKLIYLFELITVCLLEIRIPFNYLLTLENIHDSKNCGAFIDASTYESNAHYAT